MYYLQSKYYNPEICRYISADSFENLDTSNELNSNAYLYCWNNSVAFSETEGAETKISIDIEKLFAFLKNAGSFIKERLQENFEALKSKFNAFAEKVKFYFYNPDVLINQTLSFFLGREVNIRFRLIEFLKEQYKRNSEKAESSNSEEEYGIAPYYFISDDEKTSNCIEAIFKGLILAFQLDALFGIFEGIIQTFNSAFDYNDWFNGLSDTIQNIVCDISLGIVMVFNKISNGIKEYLDIEKFIKMLENKAYSEIGNWIFESFTNLGGNFFSMWENFANVFNGYMDGTYRSYQGIAVFILNLVILAISIYFPLTSTKNIFLTTLITNTMLDFEIDFENGHFWG